MSSDIEVLVVSFNSAKHIETCLERIAVLAPDLAIAVREHGSDEAALAQLTAMLAAHPCESRLEVDSSNPGFGAGCNALARTSRATWLLFLNPDAEMLTWPWGGDRRPPRRQIIGPTMVGSGATSDHSGVSYRMRDEVARSWLRRNGRPPFGAGFVSGAALLIDTDSFAMLGGFDEGYFMYYEDIDLCLRANASGVSTFINPQWEVRHTRAHSTRDRFAESLKWSYESGVRFHGARGTPVLLYRLYVTVDALLRAAAHTTVGQRARANAYISLVRHAVRDIASAKRQV